MKYAGKTVLITGGGSDPQSNVVGFGFQIAEDLFLSGANVVIVGRHQERLEDAFRRITQDKRGGTLHYFVCDISNEERVAEVFAEIGPVYGLVNNAAINLSRTNTLETRLDDFRKMIEVNYVGAFICSQNALRQMTKHGGGSIVNVSSVGGGYPFANMSPYCSMKAAMEMLALSDARDFQDQNIRVNIVRPGYSYTPLTAAYLNRIQKEEPERYAALVRRQPLGGLVTPKDVSRAVLSFLDPECNRTGEVLEVSNGYLPDKLQVKE